MYKLVVLLRKNPALSREEFIDRYENGEVQAMLAAAGKPLLYRRSYVVRPVGGHGVDAEPMTEFPFDVITEVGFPDKAASDEWFAKSNVPEVNSIADEIFAADRFLYAFELEEHVTSNGEPCLEERF
ncbi:EthD domain-containing protein [Sphingopyxis sp.]|uniref:EthD domain-containing protein n=1 Tax=Sphingopyxis sp. TaxID=1908224 RepID=UPI002D77D0FF|nr:EthD domain-containing protein [Sphingopyxis sp.]HET6522866.1 EthD domain-containing protein [Sphingopyxis sp.]